MLRVILSCLLISFQVISTSVSAQVSSSSADAITATAYSTHDSIFVFNQYPDAKKGSLRVTSPSGEPLTFEWSAYDSIQHQFLPPFQTDVNVSFSAASGLNSGGYRIRAIRPGVDTTAYVAWVHLNDFTFSVEKNNDGEVLFYRRTCEYTNLQAKVTPVPFHYFDPANGRRYLLSNPVNITWKANPAGEFSTAEGTKIWIEGEELPWEDTEYTARATDRFNLTKEDKVKYISIIPKADFETDYRKKYSDSVASAPLKVFFTNNSKNAVKYTWIFGDGDTAIMEEPENTPDPRIYFEAGKEYHLKLIAHSKQGCFREDTITIISAKSELNAPNFFSPNGDGKNPLFVIRNVSMREFHLTIFTRSGRKVYEFHGPDINEWEGWNGKMGNTDVSPGIYYYILEAVSLEKPGVKYPATKYSGFFYLFR